jgi:hypothetical protein
VHTEATLFRAGSGPDRRAVGGTTSDDCTSSTEREPGLDLRAGSFDVQGLHRSRRGLPSSSRVLEELLDVHAAGAEILPITAGSRS